MTNIHSLITAATPHIPFSPAAAQSFLANYDVNDQAALISALYIGRDHYHDDAIQPDYVPEGMVFDRYFHTGGNGSSWFINPAEFAGILYEKNSQLNAYFEAFLKCATASGYNLASF